MTREEILDFLQKHKEVLAKRYQVQKIGLFGSFAREEAHEESDIDFVIHTPIKRFRNRYELKYFLEKHLHRPVDIGYIDALHPFIRKDIEDEIIYVQTAE